MLLEIRCCYATWSARNVDGGGLKIRVEGKDASATLVAI